MASLGLPAALRQSPRALYAGASALVSSGEVDSIRILACFSASAKFFWPTSALIWTDWAMRSSSEFLGICDFVEASNFNASSGLPRSVSNPALKTFERA